MNINQLKAEWQDTQEYHSHIHETFIKNVNGCEWLNEHRTFVETHVWGFGERSFQWLWKLLVDEMPSEFKFLEIGVYKAQILSLIKMLASATGRSVERYGVTPLDSSGIDWESDYRADIEFIHDKFLVPKDYTIIHGSSTDLKIISEAKKTAPYDLLYIDGGHDRDTVDSDLFFYAPMVKKGGYLIVDDCCNDLKMQWGYFQGIQDVTDAVNDYMSKESDKWEFLFSVVHIKIYQKL